MNRQHILISLIIRSNADCNRTNKKENMTIIMVLHDINHARMYADDIVIIKDKQVFAQGSPQNTLNPDNLANVFGVKADIYQNCQKPAR